MPTLRTVLTLVTVSLAALLAGCVHPDAMFKVNDLVTRAELPGTWVSMNEDGSEVVCTITADPHPVKDGRLDRRPMNLGRPEEPARDATATAYVMESTLSRGDDGSPPLHLRARLYLIHATPYTLVCIANDSTPEMQKAADGSGLFSLRCNTFLGMEIKGDELVFHSPRVEIALLPMAEMLDSVSVNVGDPAPELERRLAQKDATGVLITPDADRAVGVLRRYGKSPGFWREETTTMRRADAPAAR